MPRPTPGVTPHALFLLLVSLTTTLPSLTLGTTTPSLFILSVWNGTSCSGQEDVLNSVTQRTNLLWNGAAGPANAAPTPASACISGSQFPSAWPFSQPDVAPAASNFSLNVTCLPNGSGSFTLMNSSDCSPQKGATPLYSSSSLGCDARFNVLSRCVPAPETAVYVDCNDFDALPLARVAVGQCIQGQKYEALLDRDQIVLYQTRDLFPLVSALTLYENVTALTPTPSSFVNTNCSELELFGAVELGTGLSYWTDSCVSDGFGWYHVNPSPTGMPTWAPTVENPRNTPMLFILSQFSEPSCTGQENVIRAAYQWMGIPQHGAPTTAPIQACILPSNESP